MISREEMTQHQQAGSFSEIVPAMKPTEAVAEANRCLFCDDAPCTVACPTGIDVPMFIRKIATGNVQGSAKTILDANPLGASCARVCPTEELCEGACVLTDLNAPLMIGRLQRYAVDHVMDHGIQLYSRGASNGRRVAIVGGGPAGLSAARELARLGYGVTVFDARAKGGGLNTYGVAPFRLPQSVSLWEVEQVTDLGVEWRSEVRVGIDVSGEQLRDHFDAVLVAVGMGKIQALGIDGEDLPGVIDALDLIEQTKDGDPGVVQIGRRVAVIGAGNTAIDGATTAKRLGADWVQILYRRTEAEMTAYPFEYEFAKRDGVEFRWLTAPKRIVGSDKVETLECVRMQLGPPEQSGRRSVQPIPGSEFQIGVDTVVMAVGQTRLSSLFERLGLETDRGVVQVDAHGRTSVSGLYAAGDCTFGGGGNDATVVLAAEQGKRSAYAIDMDIRQGVVQGG